MRRIIASNSVAAAHLEKATESDQGSQTLIILLVWSIPTVSLPARNVDQSSEASIRGVAESNPRLLTSAEAAEFLTLKESTLRDYSRRGIVPSVKIGRHLRFVEADLVGYLDGLRRAFDARLDTGFGRRKW
jgi:excisionase family DNA binding protein